jgi:hypothetical protein
MTAVTWRALKSPVISRQAGEACETLPCGTETGGWLELASITQVPMATGETR